MKPGDMILTNKNRVFGWNADVHLILKVEGGLLSVLDGNKVRKISILLEGDAFEVLQ
jgi:hypothetical protein